MRGSPNDLWSPSASSGSLASTLAVESPRALPKGGRDDEIVAGSAYLLIRKSETEREVGGLLRGCDEAGILV